MCGENLVAKTKENTTIIYFGYEFKVFVYGGMVSKIKPNDTGKVSE